VRRTKWCLSVLAAMALAAGASVGSASATTQPTPRTKAQWQAAIAKVREPGTGCYRASYPALQWHAVKCVVPPTWPGAPVRLAGSAWSAAPATVGGGGNGADYSARVPGLISQATGSFKGVSPGITETGLVGGSGAPTANAFSLQLNSGFFSTPACSGSSNPSNCQGWQQFLYNYCDSTLGCNGPTGIVFIQYWLINYGPTCPSGWMTTALRPGYCYLNSPNLDVSRS